MDKYFLSATESDLILQLRAAGHTMTAIAQQINRSRWTVSKACKGETPRPTLAKAPSTRPNPDEWIDVATATRGTEGSPEQVWLPSTAGHCRTCNGPSSFRLVEESILATYRCPVGHQFYEIAP